MKVFNREKNRKIAKVKDDIASTKKIVREDIYDVIAKTKTKQEAIKEVEGLINSLSDVSLKNYEHHGGKDQIISRIVSDLDSYGVNWDE